MTEQCPFCDGENTRYIGIDVGGYYVDQLCDEWHCDTCGADWAVGCEDYPDLTEGIDLDTGDTRPGPF